MQENPEAGGYGFDDGYLSIFTEEENVSSTVSISQTIDNVAAGSYQTGVAIVGSGNQGAQGPTKVSTVDSAVYVMNYGEEPELPGTVNANLNDGTVIPVSVTWNAEQTAALKTADFGEYTVNGTVGAFSYETRGEQVTVEA